MKNGKKLIILPLFLLASSSLAGCTDPAAGKTKVIFWHTMGQTLRTLMDKTLLPMFYKENPGIYVEHTQQGGYDDLNDKLTSAIPAGTTPTMAFCYPDHVADYNTSKACIDLTTYINDPELTFTEEDGLVDDINPIYWQEGKEYLDDGIYSVPFAKSTEMIFYNKAVFQKEKWTVPTSWEEMETFMKAAKAKYPDAIPLGYDSDANLFITMCEQYGIPYTSLNKADGHGEALFNNAAAKNMMTKLKGWVDDGLMTTQGLQNGSYTSTLFIEGKLLMTIGSTGGTSYNYDKNLEAEIADMPSPIADVSKRFDFFTGTSVTPEHDVNNHIIMQGPSICFFKKGTDEQKIAAWKLYKFLVRTMCTASYSTKSGYSPVRKSTFESETFIDYLNSKQTGADSLIQKTVKRYEFLQERYFVSPAFPGSSTARKEVDGILANICTGTKTLDKAFADAWAKTDFAIPKN
ncbi:MAG: extracellular solute-binding protein [Bacilli bacterium]|nr:extracellular solute-binding protein [Bacilli bacterium]